MKSITYLLPCVGIGLICAACSDPGEQTASGGSAGSSSSSSSSGEGGAGGGSANACQFAVNTTETSATSPSGCVILERDTSACKAARESAGLTGFWLEISCRVDLSVMGDMVMAKADGFPDYRSNYFLPNDPCHEVYTVGVQNPNVIKPILLNMNFPQMPNMTSQKMMGAIVGLLLNGVPIFGNFAAPGDDIYKEAISFDRCGGHPQMSGVYHIHSEPLSISYDDANFIGVMRDGYPIYGRKDMDESIPTLDQFGGHSGTTKHSPSTAVYHYHVNLQTSMNPGSIGQKQYFLTTGDYRGTPGTCFGCN